jgi:hypothetical protein
LYSGLLILPVSPMMNLPIFGLVLAGVPLYFALSGIVTAVAVAGAHVFAAKAGLGPPIVLTAAVGYLIALAALCAALSAFRARSAVTT